MRSIDATKVVLWIEGFSVPIMEVRQILQLFYESWCASLASLTGGLEDPERATAAVEAAVHEIAGMRSRSPLPEPMRKRRMTRAERENALVFAALSLTGLAAEVAARVQAATSVDRLMGLDRRRTAVQPFLASADPLYILRMSDPERLRAGAFETDPAELEYARRLLQISLRYGRAFMELVAQDLGPSAGEMFDMLTDATPGRTIGPLLAFGTISLAGAVHANRNSFDVSAVLDELEPDVALWGFHQALERASDRVLFRSGLSEADRVQLETRLRAEGQLPPLGELHGRRDVRAR